MSLAWDAVPDPDVFGYLLYYGQQSPNQAGSCNYGHAVFSSSPSVTVSNLAPESLYYFAVSAYNGAQSSCSGEVSAVTPSL